MAFKTLTIDSPAELHVRKGQLRHPKAETTQIALEYLACTISRFNVLPDEWLAI